MQEIQKHIESQQTVEKFTKLFCAIHKKEADDAKQMYELERFHFLKELNEKNINDVTPISALGVFLDVVSNGLSFASGAKHVYLMYRSVKAGNGYEKRLVYSTTPDGKIFQAEKAGSIEYVTKPVIVYEGEDFAVETNEQGEQIIRHKVKFPRQSNKIVAGYVYVVFKGGKREPFWMDTNDIERLKGYSAKSNKTAGANALYTANNGQIDPGFFGAKLINFALKNVRKSGTASQFEVNGDTGDAAMLTGTTELPDAEGATYAAAMVVEPAEPAQPANQIPSSNEPF